MPSMGITPMLVVADFGVNRKGRLMFCMACGQELSDEVVFCPKCGRAVRSTEVLRAAKPSDMELHCPTCAATLGVSPEMTTCTCTTCGSGLLVVREHETVTLRESGERLP
jgi:hypothetical protein